MIGGINPDFDNLSLIAIRDIIGSIIEIHQPDGTIFTMPVMDAFSDVNWAPIPNEVGTAIPSNWAPNPSVWAPVPTSWAPIPTKLGTPADRP